MVYDLQNTFTKQDDRVFWKSGSSKMCMKEIDKGGPLTKRRRINGQWEASFVGSIEIAKLVSVYKQKQSKSHDLRNWCQVFIHRPKDADID